MNKLNKFSRATIAIAIMLCVALPTFAHHFEVNGIYYEYLDESAKTVAVTYKGSSYYSYSDEYTGAVTIPSTVTYNRTTYSVTSIGEDAFSGCTGLTSVTIPNSVTEIGNGAFYRCSGLTEVTIPNSVTSIGSSAFNNCKFLPSVTIPNSVTSIGDRAFYECSNLKLVINLSNLTFSEGSSNYGYVAYYANKVINAPNNSIVGDFVFSKTDNINTLVAYIGNATELILPTDFNGENYKIGDYAFAYRSNIFHVTIPNSVTSIGDYAFYRSSGLTSITIPNSVTAIGSYAFFSCTGLTSVTIPNSVTSIGKYAFSDCTGLTEVTIPNSVTSIGSSAFRKCYRLTSVTIPNSVTSIGNSAFEYCTGLTSVTIPNSVTAIGSYAFFSCDGLTSVTIPNSVISIGSSAFYGCSGLTSITIPNSVTAIGDYAFAACYGLTSVTIPNSVTSIGNRAFEYCSGLTSVTIPNSVTSIGDSAFGYCSGLTSITIPNSVTSIGMNAFYNCYGLTSVTIPNSVTSIGNNAFWGCNKLISRVIIDKTQTTVSIALATPTKYKTGVVNENGKIASESNIVSIKGLKPGVNHTYNAALIINDIFCEINSVSFTTDDVIFKNSDIVGATSVSSKANYEGDVTVLEYGIKWGDNAVEYNNIDSISVYNLDPDTNYDIYYFLNTKEGGEYSTSWSVRTKLLTWNVGEFVATSTTSARLSVETNCDATQGTGYEWKRYDAPETLAPSKAPCPVVNGKLTGSLRGLNSSAYYNCRPYYTSSSGKTYYGEWFTIFTGDANVYFEPEVSTSDKNTVVDNSAVINGYALAGSDDILEEGFEYWKTSSSPTTYSSSGVMIAKASGISMSATITNLEYKSTYRYRAYVKTSKGSFYGSEKELIIGDPAGVGYIESDVKDAEEVARYDIHGRLLSEPARGINIIKMSDGTTRKEIVK